MSESQLIEYKESWRAYGIAEPEYTVHPNDIMMMFKANDPINLFDLIKENPNFSYDEYAKKLGVSSATIKRHIGELKNSGKIIRKGSNKTGYWEIVKQ